MIIETTLPAELKGLPLRAFRIETDELEPFDRGWLLIAGPPGAPLDAGAICIGQTISGPMVLKLHAAGDGLAVMQLDGENMYGIEADNLLRVEHIRLWEPRAASLTQAA